MNKISYSSTVKGLSHFRSGTECQDSSLNEAISFQDDYIHFIAVSDGHGSATYVRSKQGSNFLTLVAKKELVEFVKNNVDLLEPKPIKDYGTFIFGVEIKKLVINRNKLQAYCSNLKEKANQTIKENEQKLLERLKEVKFRIIEKWKKMVDKDLKENPLELTQSCMYTFDENLNYKKQQYIGYSVSDDHQFQYINRGITQDDINETIKNHYILYGATLLCSCSYKDNTFLLQIGDGDAVIIDNDNNAIHPVPDFDDQYDNITHSICERKAERYFTEYYTKDKIKIILIATDGVSKSFYEEKVKNDIAELANEVYNTLIEKPRRFKKMLQEILEAFANASTDDCSIAFIASNIDDNMLNRFDDSNSIFSSSNNNDKLIHYYEDTYSFLNGCKLSLISIDKHPNLKYSFLLYANDLIKIINDKNNNNNKRYVLYKGIFEFKNGNIFRCQKHIITYDETMKVAIQINKKEDALYFVTEIKNNVVKYIKIEKYKEIEKENK